MKNDAALMIHAVNEHHILYYTKMRSSMNTESDAHYVTSVAD